MLSVRFSCEMQSSMSKLWIALVALMVALLVTGAHADACHPKSSFKQFTTSATILGTR
jgi:hypothetical protein